MFGDQLYPSPEKVSSILRGVVGWDRVRVVLDPSAGRGDLLDGLSEFLGRPVRTLAIEIDPDLQNVLRGRKHAVLDADFLTYSGVDHCDLILMNPPFNKGAKHLLRAIDMMRMHGGQIACLLNAETLRNPFSNERKELLSWLNRLDAAISYHSELFVEADRTTSVECAAVYLDFRKYRKDADVDYTAGLLAACSSEVDAAFSTTDVQVNDPVAALVRRHDYALEKVRESLIFWERFGRELGDVITVAPVRSDGGTLAQRLSSSASHLREVYWRQVLQMETVRARMTREAYALFLKQLEAISCMAFTEANIQQFILTVAGSYQQVLDSAIDSLAGLLTRDHAYYPECKNNVLHYNGWKTNNAFKINKKVIVPGYRPFCDIFKKFKVDYTARPFMDDLDKVMAYFDGRCVVLSGDDKWPPKPLAESLEAAFAAGQTVGIDSTYFTVTAYKKGTYHLVFKDATILRRFNMFIGRHRGFLPHDYGRKPKRSMRGEEAEVMQAFDGAGGYVQEWPVSDSAVAMLGFALQDTRG